MQTLVPDTAQVKPRPYKVRVATTDERGAGTDASVFVTLHGSTGSSGRRRLETKADNFERGRTDEFVVMAVDLGDVERVEIGHDGVLQMLAPERLV